MNKLWLSLPVAVALMLSGCDENSGAEGPESATQKTTVRSVICLISGANCFVAARFPNLDACEEYKKFLGMKCDGITSPGRLICATDAPSPLVSSYCIP